MELERFFQGLPPKELFETIQRGLICHLRGNNACSNIPSHGWIFLFSYVLFVISMVNFLSMCESAVFTVAAATVSLPLSGIWWSLYKMDVGSNGGQYGHDLPLNFDSTIWKYFLKLLTKITINFCINNAKSRFKKKNVNSCPQLILKNHYFEKLLFKIKFSLKKIIILKTYHFE